MDLYLRPLIQRCFIVGECAVSHSQTREEQRMYESTETIFSVSAVTGAMRSTVIVIGLGGCTPHITFQTRENDG